MITFKSAMPELKIKYVPSSYPNRKISSSEIAFESVKIGFDMDLIHYREEFVALFLNRANNTIGYMRLAQGSGTGVVVNTQMLFITALECGAHGIIIAHNHPSGRLVPSDEDNRLTNKVLEGGKLLDITLLDHLIISENKYFSYQDEGKL